VIKDPSVIIHSSNEICIGEESKHESALIENFVEKRIREEREQEMLKRLRTHVEKLEKINRLKDEFSAMVSHELKTPLAPIVGYSELLLDGTFGDLNPVQIEKIKVIQESALNLTDLINDILDVNKLELNKMRFDMRSVSIDTIVKQSVDSFKYAANAKKVKLVYNVEKDLNLYCDPKRIQQVLNNLINNSLKFVPQNTGIIEIVAKREGNSHLFAVKDNGIGISKENHEKLFKKFYQVDTSLGRKAGGTGLGLAISKGIIEAHKGKMWIESEAGKGSVFYFIIPIRGRTEDVK
jgi:signal transduction histidine kinase